MFHTFSYRYGRHFASINCCELLGELSSGNHSCREDANRNLALLENKKRSPSFRDVILAPSPMILSTLLGWWNDQMTYRSAILALNRLTKPICLFSVYVCVVHRNAQLWGAKKKHLFNRYEPRQSSLESTRDYSNLHRYHSEWYKYSNLNDLCYTEDKKTEFQLWSCATNSNFE